MWRPKGWLKSRKGCCSLSIGLYIVLVPRMLKICKKLQEKRFVFVKILAIIIPENGAKVSKIKCLRLNQQTLIIFFYFGVHAYYPPSFLCFHMFCQYKEIRISCNIIWTLQQFNSLNHIRIIFCSHKLHYSCNLICSSFIILYTSEFFY